MANTPQSKKRVRQNERRRLVNQARRSRIRTFIRKFEDATKQLHAPQKTTAKPDVDAAHQAVQAAFRQAQAEIMRGVTKGIWHKNTAARKVSRLHARMKAVHSSV